MTRFVVYGLLVCGALHLAGLPLWAGSAGTPESVPTASSERERAKLATLSNQIDGRVVFSRRNRIYRVDIGHWEPRDLGPGRYARWSPDGRRIAVWHNRRIFILDADGGNRREILSGADQVHDSPIAFQPDNLHIAYVVRGVGLHQVNIETGKTESMELPGRYTGETSLSANGRRLAARWGNDLYVVDLESKEHRRYARGCSPGISPSGRLMMNNVGGHTMLEIQEWDGEAGKRLTAREARPDGRWDNHHWSNHEDFIAAHGDGKVGEIYLIQVSTNDIFRITWLGDCRDPDLFVALRDSRSDEPEQTTETQALKPKPPPWPQNRHHLVFAWRTLADSNELYNPEGRRLGSCRLTPFGQVFYGRHHEMALRRGRFVMENAGVDLTQSVGAHGGITLTMTVAAENVRQDGLILWWGDASEPLLSIRQRGRDIVLEGGGRTGRLTSDLAKRVNLAVRWDGQELLGYVDGRRTIRLQTPKRPDWRRADRLVLGAEPRDQAFWAGTIEGLAVWGGIVEERRLISEMRRYADETADRPEVPRFTVRARRADEPPALNPRRIEPYRRALTSEVFEVRQVLQGELVDKRILVSHWSILDAEPVAWPGGEEVVLVLERLRDHPQLESEYRQSEVEAEDMLLPEFYAVGPIKPSSP